MTNETNKKDTDNRNKATGMSSHLLIPVDFSPSAMLAVRVGMHFAKLLKVNPVIMHVYPIIWNPEIGTLDPYDSYDANDEEIETAIENHDVQRIAEHQFARLRKKIRQDQLDGKLPDVKFSTLLVQGIAEDAILDYCRDNNPRLVVMSTRGVHKKEEDLIGSVTAEVLDSCRVPVFTVPDNYADTQARNISRVLMFCTLDQYDVPALETLMETFDQPDVEIWLMPATNRHLSEIKDRLAQLHAQLSERWQQAKFHTVDIEEKEVNSHLDDYLKQIGIEVIISPNRKTSIFTRLFRPSVAHQCLFALDIPMLALPVGK